MEKPDLPLRRFLQQPRVFVPNVELVAESELSLDQDPYISDHIYERVPLFPAVMGLEAMLQVSGALARTERLPELESVHFDQPVAVYPGQSTKIRIAALARPDQRIEVVLRSAETDFQQDHFRAICNYGRVASQPSALDTPPEDAQPLVPAVDLYGELLFHTGRFQRVTGYRHLSARACTAEVESAGQDEWFGAYLPPQRLLGDSAVRDSVIHAIQACIPHATLLPIGVDHLKLAPNLCSPVTVVARERSHLGDEFKYDVDVLDNSGVCVESWRGLLLRAVKKRRLPNAACAALLRPYLERRIGELTGNESVELVIEFGGEEQDRKERAVERLLGSCAHVYARPDGKPELANGRQVSFSHQPSLTAAVTSHSRVSCDVESVSERPESTWQDLLGAEQRQLAEQIQARCDESNAVSRTHVWCAMECLRKAGQGDGPLLLDGTTPDGWVVMRTGHTRIASWNWTRPDGSRLVISVLAGESDAQL